MQKTNPMRQRLEDAPWWLIAIIGIGLYLGYRIIIDDLYSKIFSIIIKGVWTTLFVSFICFFLACVIGLILAVFALSKSKILQQIARFYVEVIRGIPILVLLFYVAFVFVPTMVFGVNYLLEQIDLYLGIEISPIKTRDFSFLWRAIIALTIGYSAFMSEIFRAGIQSVEAGQLEAAQALGLKRWHRFSKITFPQAIVVIMPPLGNNFIALIKDSSLVSVLGVTDITQLGKIYSAGSFRFFETYNIVAYVYLALTLTLSLVLRRIELKMRDNKLD